MIKQILSSANADFAWISFADTGIYLVLYSVKTVNQVNDQNNGKKLLIVKQLLSTILNKIANCFHKINMYSLSFRIELLNIYQVFSYLKIRKWSVHKH